MKTTTIRAALTSCRRPTTSRPLARRRARYIAGLTEFRGDDVVPWVRQFADTAAESADLARVYLGAVLRKVEEWGAALRGHGAPRSDAAAWQLIDVLPARPMITGPTALAATGRARAAVYQALDQLERAGVLVAASGSHRNRVWEAEGLLALLEGLESGDAAT